MDSQPLGYPMTQSLAARPPSNAAARSLTGLVAGALDAEDPLRALALLNARIRFRFTGVFHVDPPYLRNILLFDRENPSLNVSGGIDTLDIGFCGVTCATNAPFSTSDARRDPRLVTHPARTSMLSYSGVPIRAASGRAWGTLCHYDGRPRLLPRGELALLEDVALLFTSWLEAHGFVR